MYYSKGPLDTFFAARRGVDAEIVSEHRIHSKGGMGGNAEEYPSDKKEDPLGHSM